MKYIRTRTKTLIQAKTALYRLLTFTVKGYVHCGVDTGIRDPYRQDKKLRSKL